MYKVKKKRAVDPNAPPRPNLMTHEVKLRTAQGQLAQMEELVQRMARRVDELESKMRHQTAYLNQLHTVISTLRRK